MKISSLLVMEMVHDSLAEYHEVCGFLLGVVEDEGFKVVKLYKAKNISPTSQIRFEVDPRSVYEAHRYAEEVGLEVIGIYHSHPGPPIPSAIDLESMKSWPVVWLIISSVDGSIAAYVVESGSVKRLEILLE
ncbi:MAG: M67 family metallopeptidase [Candidatus Nezhaarchaeales archaeon]